MNSIRLIVTCDKCGGYTQPHSPWLTDDKQLLIRSVCINCGKGIETFYPLIDLYNGCPSPDYKQLRAVIDGEIERITDNRPLVPVEITPQDEKILKSFGIVPSIKFTPP